MSSSGKTLETNAIAKQSLLTGKTCISHRNYECAFKNFLVTLELAPSLRDQLREDFILASREWSEELLNAGRLQELFSCYAQVCELFPDCEEILNNIGAQLFRLGYIEDAAQYIRKALKVNPRCIVARENFENVCGHLVERWHFRMLNDVRRNTAYQAALRQGVRNSRASVLDIGAGTGLLSMMAVTAGAEAVYACERSRTMCDVAAEVLYINKMSDKVVLIPKSSTDLIIPQDIPHRVSLVVTETFDAGLFGEQVLSTLQHAWKHLLAQDRRECRPRVIPSAAQVYVCAIQCGSVSKQNRCRFPGIEGVDFSSVPIICDTGTVDNEPYTTEELASIREGYTELSEVTPLLHVDFSDPQRIAELLKGVQDIISCPIRCTGQLDALAIWFDLHLDDTITISTSPADENCWHQAIFPVFSHHLNKVGTKDVEVKEGDRLRVQYVCKDDKLTVQCVGVDRAAEDKTGQSQTPEQCNIHVGKPLVADEDRHPGVSHSSEKFKCLKLSVKTSELEQCSHACCSYEQCSHACCSCEQCSHACCSYEQCSATQQESLDMVKKYSEQQFSASSSRKQYVRKQSSHGGKQSSRGGKQSSHGSKQSSYGGKQSPHCEQSELHLSEQYSCSIQEKHSEQLCWHELSLAERFPSDSLSQIKCSDKESPGDSRACNTTQSSHACPSIISDPRMIPQMPSSSSLQQVTGADAKNRKSRFSLPRSKIGALNDDVLNRAICQALQNVHVNLRRKTPASLTLLEYSHGLSPFGLNALMSGFDRLVTVLSSAFGMEEESSSDRAILSEVMKENGIEKEKVVCLDSVVNELPENQKADCLLVDLAEPCGVFHQQVLENLALMRVTCLGSDGVILPAGVSVYGLLIESLALQKASEVVGDSWTLGYHIADTMNEFQMSTHIDIDLSTLPHKRLSNPLKLLDLQFNEPATSPEDLFAEKLGDVPPFLEMKREVDVSVTQPGTLTAVIFWYDIHLWGTVHVDTSDPRCHWKQAAVMMPERVTLSTNEILTLYVSLKNSCIRISTSPSTY